MGTPLVFLDQPVLVTAVGAQSIELAADVSAYDVIDMEFGLLAIQGTAGASPQIYLITSMQNQVDDGSWYSAGLVTTGTAPPVWSTFRLETSSGTPLLRYLRWYVADLKGATSLTFTYSGIGRKK